MGAGCRRGHPFIASVYDRLLGSFQERVRPHRRSLLDHAAGRLMELGAGTGANFEFYSQVAALTPPVIATEPDPYMIARARQRARAADIDIELVGAQAEDLPFDTEAFDTVVGTFVMCTVREPERALAEVKRVLRPGGLYLFMEHVRSEQPLMRLMQNMTTPVWKRVAGGCHINRDTVSCIAEQGFELVELVDPGVGSRLLPLVVGVARQGGL